MAKRSGISWVELIAVIGLFVLLALIFAPGLSSPPVAPRYRPSCQNNLKQWGLIFKMYALESVGDRFPPMYVDAVGTIDCDNTARGEGGFGVFAAGPEMTAVYPKYLSDPRIVFCPDDPDRMKENWGTLGGIPREKEFGIPCEGPHQGSQLIDDSYVYIGYVADLIDSVAPTDDPAVPIGILDGLPPWLDVPRNATMPRQMAELLGPLLKKIIAGQPADWRQADKLSGQEGEVDTEGLGTGGRGTTVFRFSEGVERFLITDINNPAASDIAQSETWIMCDTFFPADSSFNHEPRGANVLFLDGHVDFVPYPETENCRGEGPVNDVMGNTFTLLSAVSAL